MRIGAGGLARHFLLWALLTPFVMLSAVARPVMPHRPADGTLTLILCGVDGPGEVVIDLASGQPVEDAPDETVERCALAGAGAIVAALHRTSAPRRSAHTLATAPLADPVPPTLPAPVLLPPPTGPPAA